MDLSFLESLDNEQRQLDQKKADARKAVLAEIQRLIDRIGAKTSELQFPAEEKTRGRKRRRHSAKTGETAG